MSFGGRQAAPIASSHGWRRTSPLPEWMQNRPRSRWWPVKHHPGGGETWCQRSRSCSCSSAACSRSTTSRCGGALILGHQTSVAPPRSGGGSRHRGASFRRALVRSQAVAWPNGRKIEDADRGEARVEAPARMGECWGTVTGYTGVTNRIRERRCHERLIDRRSDQRLPERHRVAQAGAADHRWRDRRRGARAAAKSHRGGEHAKPLAVVAATLVDIVPSRSGTFLWSFQGAVVHTKSGAQTRLQSSVGIVTTASSAVKRRMIGSCPGSSRGGHVGRIRHGRLAAAGAA